jgi:hypothetical protein
MRQKKIKALDRSIICEDQYISFRRSVKKSLIKICLAINHCTSHIINRHKYEFLENTLGKEKKNDSDMVSLLDADTSRVKRVSLSP